MKREAMESAQDMTELSDMLAKYPDEPLVSEGARKKMGGGDRRGSRARPNRWMNSLFDCGLLEQVFEK
jgi:hypothetical protein